jgi:hypothetical protein
MKTLVAWMTWGLALTLCAGCSKTAEPALDDSGGVSAEDAGALQPPEQPVDAGALVAPAGPLPQGEEKDGQRVGRWTFFHANGQKSAEGEYQAGQKQGPWTYYYDNGQKTAEGRFENGEKTGRWVEWDEAGQQVADKNYADGIEVLPPR